ncbi:hypothetical protein ACIQBJ_31340 [Kitasatospora sp. NPDC088391]|uniref:hypothetical protein n=1 Tax=Kitasatospora sp. NPDC088391 TaxID=3364074 RepID=UPI0037F7FC11
MDEETERQPGRDPWWAVLLTCCSVLVVAGVGCFGLLVLALATLADINTRTAHGPVAPNALPGLVAGPALIVLSIGAVLWRFGPGERSRRSRTAGLAVVAGVQVLALEIARLLLR